MATTEGLSPRELHLLRQLLDAELRNAQLTESRWRETTPRRERITKAALMEEQAFARGYLSGLTGAVRRLNELLPEAGESEE